MHPSEVRTPLRVGILAVAAKSYGQESYFRALLPALERYGDETEYVVITRNNRFQDLVSSKRIRFFNVEGEQMERGPVRVWWEQTVLPGIISRINIDLIYTANNVAVLRSPKPCVIAVHNMEPFVPVAQGVKSTLKMRYWILRQLTLKSIHSARRIVAVSEFVRHHLLALGTPAEKIDVIYHGIDDLPAGPSSTNGANVGYAVAAAKFIRYANLTGLVRAYARMRQLGFNGDLLVAGGSYDRQYEAEVRALVVKLGLSERVRFLGYVPRDQVQALMRSCSVFLFPSTLEACPFTLLEAMRQGAPIVATTAEPMPEFCGGAALLTSPSDPERFGDAAYKLATSPDLQVAMRARSRARAEAFQWKNNVTQLIQTFRRASPLP